MNFTNKVDILFLAKNLFIICRTSHRLYVGIYLITEAGLVSRSEIATIFLLRKYA
jgi:hypothetical protein